MQKRIYILEGPDGGGKTTLGHELSARLGVPVDNHGPYKGEAQIWLHYFNSMVPAYKGERDVILDRCWLAEPIYGKVFRGGMNRLELWQERILEHVAKECWATVIFCLPPFKHCLDTFNGRRAAEMLETGEQLKQVYEGYEDAALDMLRKPGGLRTYVYDFTNTDQSAALLKKVLA